MENEQEKQSSADAEKKQEDSPKKSIKDGLQAIETNKNLGKASGDTAKVKETDKKDAEKWRNEG